MFKFKPELSLIDAIQWKNGKLVIPEGMPVPAWLQKAFNGASPGTVNAIFCHATDVRVNTPMGLAIVTDGDWIVCDKAGDLWGWKDRAFRQHFTPVEQHTPDAKPINIDWDAWEKAHGH